MPVKKHIRPGKIEASPNGDALVVNFTSEVTHLDEDGMPISVEKTQEKREVPVGQAMRGLTTSEDIRSLAREIVEKCRYIPKSKTSQVEKVLNKLYALQTDVQFKDFAGATKSSTKRTTGGDSNRDDDRAPSQLEDLLPFASMHSVDDYIEELYEEDMDMKVQGARKLLRLCTEVPVLEQLADHSTLLGVLSRELRENAKRSYELAVAITGIFLIFANFSGFHAALSKYQCGEVTMHILEYETKRRHALQKDAGCHALLDRQDHLLQICILVLRAISEETALELKFVKHNICQMLPPLLSRQHEDLLFSTLNALHKLTIFEQNKDVLIGEMPRFVELLGHPANEVFSMALRLCYNLSFDARGRAALAEQSAVVPRLMHAVQHQSTHKVALKLLYHMTLDPPVRSSLIRTSPHLPSLALQLARSKEQEPEAVALLVNLAADEAAACLILAEDSFMAVSLKAFKHKNIGMLKVVRHITSHTASRSILLDVMGGGDSSSYAWLVQLVQMVKATAADRHDVLVEVLGILAALDCPEVPWVDLCEAGLLEPLLRLLMVGFAEDDVVLEAVMLLSLLALDPPAAALLPSSKVIGLLPDLLAAKSGDADLLVQLLFLVQCLLMLEETRDVLLQETDVPLHIMDLVRSSSQSEAIELLDLILAVESRAYHEPRWTRRIQECKFKLHNQEWLAACNGQDPERSPSLDASKRSMNSGWGSTEMQDSRREEKKSRRKKGR